MKESGAHGHCYHHTVVANSCHICQKFTTAACQHHMLPNNTPTSRIWYTVKDDMPTAICTAYTQGLGFHIPERLIWLPDAMGSPQTKFLRSPCGRGRKARAKIWSGGWALRMSVSALPETTAGSLWNIIRVETSSLAWCPGDEAYSSCILLEKFGSIVIQANNAMDSTLIVVTIVVSQSLRTSVSAKLSAILCSSPQYENFEPGNCWEVRWPPRLTYRWRYCYQGTWKVVHCHAAVDMLTLNNTSLQVFMQSPPNLLLASVFLQH